MRRINDVLLLAKMKCRQVCMKDNHKPFGVVMALSDGIEPSIMKFKEFQFMEHSENSWLLPIHDNIVVNSLRYA